MYWKIGWIEWGTVRPAVAVIWMMLFFILKWKGSISLIKQYFWKNIHKFLFYSRFKFQMLNGPTYIINLSLTSKFLWAKIHILYDSNFLCRKPKVRSSNGAILDIFIYIIFFFVFTDFQRKKITIFQLFFCKSAIFLFIIIRCTNKIPPFNKSWHHR